MAFASNSILFLFFKTVQGRRKQKDQKPAFMVPFMNADEEYGVLKHGKKWFFLPVKMHGGFSSKNASLSSQLVYLAKIRNHVMQQKHKCFLCFVILWGSLCNSVKGGQVGPWQRHVKFKDDSFSAQPVFSETSLEKTNHFLIHILLYDFFFRMNIHCNVTFQLIALENWCPWGLFLPEQIIAVLWNCSSQHPSLSALQWSSLNTCGFWQQNWIVHFRLMLSLQNSVCVSSAEVQVNFN